MTLTEQERRAYADGDTRTANLLASLMDADKDKDELEDLRCRADERDNFEDEVYVLEGKVCDLQDEIDELQAKLIALELLERM